MEILNLFSGIGGNRTLWGDTHEITAVENNQQIALVYHKRFPNDKIIIADAYEYLLWNYEDYDFIWASPPCQTHSWANNWLHIQGCRRYPDMKLWQLITFLRKFSEYKDYEIKWVIENVKPYYNPFLKPDFIIGRHYFWSNFNLHNKMFEFSPITILNAKGSKRRDHEEYIRDLCKWHHINKKLIDFLKDPNWKNNDLKGQVLRNCVKPEIGKYILDHIEKLEQKSIEDYL